MKFEIFLEKGALRIGLAAAANDADARFLARAWSQVCDFDVIVVDEVAETPRCQYRGGVQLACRCPGGLV